MDLIDFVLEEGTGGRLTAQEVLQANQIRQQIRASGRPVPPFESFRTAGVKNGIETLSFLQQPLPKAQEQDFAKLKRLLPHP